MHAEQGCNVPAVWVGAASEPLTGLGVGAPFGLGCSVGGLVVELRTDIALSRQLGEWVLLGVHGHRWQWPPHGKVLRKCTEDSGLGCAGFPAHEQCSLAKCSQSPHSQVTEVT